MFFLFTLITLFFLFAITDDMHDMSTASDKVTQYL
jgi:hypothetical protein